MPKALSADLRERVVRAVAEGASRRTAAARFGVRASSAMRWCARRRETGTVTPGVLGGDRRSVRIEAHGALILALVTRTPDITRHELKAALAEAGVQADIGTLWRFFDRRQITRKIDSTCRRTGPSRHREAAPRLVRSAA